jgi:hypothetical protein
MSADLTHEIGDHPITQAAISKLATGNRLYEFYAVATTCMDLRTAEE